MSFVGMRRRMVYVDLNPIHAQMAETLEGSDHTSIQKRISDAKQSPETQTEVYQPKTLFPFVGNPREPMPAGLPFRLEDYLELVDWTGRCLRTDKHGAISQSAPPILQRLNVDPKNWLYSTQHFKRSFKSFAGCLETVKRKLPDLGFACIPNIGALLT